MTVCLPVRVDARTALSDAERAAVEALSAACRLADGYDACMNYDTHLNADPGLAAWRLAWALPPACSDCAPLLVGAASAFAPGRSEGELCACVHPVFRRQGLFASLCAALSAELRASGAESILLVCESASPFASSIASSLGASRDHGELVMSLPPGRLAEARPPEGLRLAAVSALDLGELSALSAAVFGEPEADARAFAEAALADRSREQFMARTGDGAVGMVSLARHGDAYELFGLGVLPVFRGSGLGGAVLDACLTVVRGRGASRVSLEVDDANEPALRLYRSRGFTEESRVEYWRLPPEGAEAEAKSP